MNIFNIKLVYKYFILDLNMSEIYKIYNEKLSDLISQILQGDIGLPDLQRPYIRQKSQARNLIDSMYIWYPIWNILLLENERDSNFRVIWNNDKRYKTPRYVVIDWQQRLTSLFAIITWEEVLYKSSKDKIIISFNPIEEKFEVANSSTEKWSERIYDIKPIIDWNDYEITNEYNEKNKDKLIEKNILNKDISERIKKVKDILKHEFDCIIISKNVPLKQVSEIFLRINWEWKKLNNSDFILTLMSVYWEEWRKKVEKFSQYTKIQNDIIDLDSEDVVKILIGAWLYRAKLEDAYKFLKRTWEDFPDLTLELDFLTNSHNRQNFLNIFRSIWFVDKSLFTQKATSLACCIFYIIWVKKFWIDYLEIKKLLQKYFIRTYIWAKYVSSWETTLEKDLKELQKAKDLNEFVNYINSEANLYLNDDSWNIKLPKDINTSSSLNSIFISYIASQIFYNRKILFNDVSIWNYFIWKSKSDVKSEIDHHHIFPRNYLLENYWIDWIQNSEINQIANKVYCYNTDNKIIWDKSPREYIKFYKEKFWEQKINESLKENQIHEKFYEMSYHDFLLDRQKRILDSLKKYVYEVSNPEKKSSEQIDYKNLISFWESNNIEFKSTFRWNIEIKQIDENIKYQVVKTIAWFLNTDWWTLFIGVKDNWDILWLDYDINSYSNKNTDSLLKDIDNTLKNFFSNQYANINVKILKLNEKDICIVEVLSWNKPTYIKYNNKEEFYIRRSASSSPLTLSEAHSYIIDHF